MHGMGNGHSSGSAGVARGGYISALNNKTEQLLKFLQ